MAVKFQKGEGRKEKRRERESDRERRQGRKIFSE